MESMSRYRASRSYGLKNLSDLQFFTSHAIHLQKKRSLFAPVAIILSATLLVSCEREETHWDESAIPISMKCAACHQEQYQQWVSSDHAWSARPVLPQDAEAFRSQSLTAHGSTLSFTQTAQGDLMITDRTSGQNHPVRYVVGRIPLVQYMVPGKDGGMQAPSAAWDPEKCEWFDLFEQDARLSAEGLAHREAGDWGHWLGRGMNWDSQCAWCHMSGFRKNYNAENDTYAATHVEPGVTCIQCHKLADKPDADDGCLVAKHERKLTPAQDHDNCATCHARREEFDDTFCVGDRFDDHFRLELPLIPSVFWPTGMQRDEVYCETGFRLSRMGAAGVTCIDCHDPHTGQLKLPQEDNSLCLRCHSNGTEVNGIVAPYSEGAPKGLCPPHSMGGRCVECHMPTSNYMARDPRRDHSMTIPNPALSAELSIPNSCTMCHKDKDDAWAAAELERVLSPGDMKKVQRDAPRTRAVHAATLGKGNTADLLAAYRAEPTPAWRATLLELLARQQPSAQIAALAREAMHDPSPMVRAAAAKALPSEAAELLHDPVRLVRHAAAWAILPVSPRALEGSPALEEIKATALHQADQPAGAMQLAVLAASEHNTAEACRQYERAISLDPASPVPYMDYAVYLARQNKPLAALQQMLACTKVAPQNAEAQYRLGLILAEIGQYPAALTSFERAVQADPTHEAATAARDELRRYLDTQNAPTVR